MNNTVSSTSSSEHQQLLSLAEQKGTDGTAKGKAPADENNIDKQKLQVNRSAEVNVNVQEMPVPVPAESEPKKFPVPAQSVVVPASFHSRRPTLAIIQEPEHLYNQQQHHKERELMLKAEEPEPDYDLADNAEFEEPTAENSLNSNDVGKKVLAENGVPQHQIASPTRPTGRQPNETSRVKPLRAEDIRRSNFMTAHDEHRPLLLFTGKTMSPMRKAAPFTAFAAKLESQHQQYSKKLVGSFNADRNEPSNCSNDTLITINGKIIHA